MDGAPAEKESGSVELSTAFSLPRFIPLLQERIIVINPFTRMFLVSWITLLDSIPDLELVSYLPSFLQGLFRFLSDPNQDVHTATQGALERFLLEIKKIARIKRGIAESKKSAGDEGVKHSSSSIKSGRSIRSAASVHSLDNASIQDDVADPHDGQDSATMDSESFSDAEDKSGSAEGDWLPGQDVQVDHPKILDILVHFLSDSSGMFIDGFGQRL